MPRKPRKTHEEKVAESYFPVDKSDVEYATEKIEKAEKKIVLSEHDLAKKSVEIPIKDPLPKEEILKGAVEKEYLKPDRKSLEKVIKVGKKKKQARKKKAKSMEKYSPPKTELKKNGYELIITEKPQAALKISSALGKSTKKNSGSVPYYEVERDGKKIIVACAVGHLFTLKQNTPGSEVPVFDISWIPNYMARKNDFTKRYHDTLLKLAKNAGSITVATDYDIEGELIGLNVVRFICNQKDAKRMKFSTLTEKELNKAYEEKSSSVNWGQAIAGETRHYLDWFYGINLSRALMNAIKTTGKFRIMSIGRVQGPALNLIVQKEREIQSFKPTPYWQVFIEANDGKNSLELKHNKDIFEKKELKKFENLIGKTATAETKKTEQIIPPSPPFNLTTLQTEAYKLHGITPSNTLRAAQSLYLSGLISYPRTSSQKLPDSIGYREILKRLAKKYNAEHLIKREKPVEGKKTDPAHPSIYPTGQNDSIILSGDEEKIYNLIVKRFLSLFCEDAIIDNKKITASVDELKFSAKGLSVRKKAWMEIYPVKMKENEIPDMKGEVKITDSRIEEKETQPPKRYSPASIVSELEKRNLGTKATRSSILETLYERNYIKEKSIEATPLGISLIETLEKYSPIIIDEELTRHFEKEMDKIQEEKEGFMEHEKRIISEAKEAITKIAKQFEKNEKEIGKELLQANIKLREQQKAENTLCACPECGKGNLAITYSKKTKRNFIACDSYPECTKTYSLPPNGTIKKTTPLKNCEKCNFPMLISLRKGKRPWTFCFNPECETNKERLEEYRKKKEEKGE